MNTINKLLHKKAFYIVMLLVLAGLITGIVISRKQKQKAAKEDEKVYQVSVMKAGETGGNVNLTYTGLIQPDETTQCTFETIGTIQSVNVKVGDKVHSGDVLCTIDSTDALERLDNANRALEYAARTKDNAKTSYDNALADYNKSCGTSQEQTNLAEATERRDKQQAKVDELKEKLADNPGDYALRIELESSQSTLEIYQRNVDSAQEAYNKKAKEGATSNEARAQKDRLDMAEEAFNNANESFDNANSNVKTAQEAVDKCTLKAAKDGYVVKVTATEGSVSTPIVPAVVLASNNVVVNFGISQSDLPTVSAGMPVTITVGKETFTGSIKDIDVVPNEESRTYSTNVSLDVVDSDLYLGELATVDINVGERVGIWLPLSTILNDGKDYIYVVENNRAKRKYIKIEQINNDQVLVTGTSTGELIIYEGMKLIRSGSAVSYDLPE